MSTLRLEVLSGASSGRVIEPDGDVVRIGRAPINEIELQEAHVSGEHARIVVGLERVELEDLRSTNGTALVRNGNRIVLSEDTGLVSPIESGDVIELGGVGEEATRLLVTLGDEPEPVEVVALRPISEISGTTASSERNTDVLKGLFTVQQAVSAAADLDDVLVAVTDGALALVPRATHATLVLRDDRNAVSDSGFVPVMTRVRGTDGRAHAPPTSVPITRSVFRKVLRERASVLAADAPSESFSSESLLGASIKSTIGVPLWKGEEIHGVLQVDNRDAPAMFDAADVDALGVLSATASLAVANARLIARLSAAEEQLKKENTFLKHRRSMTRR